MIAWSTASNSKRDFDGMTGNLPWIRPWGWRSTVGLLFPAGFGDGSMEG